MNISYEKGVENVKWFYKPFENMTCNLAVISIGAPHSIRFLDQAGNVFDRMRLSANEDPVSALVTNGFMAVEEGDDFSRLIGLPHTIIDGGDERQPVYSSGEYWVE